MEFTPRTSSRNKPPKNTKLHARKKEKQKYFSSCGKPETKEKRAVEWTPWALLSGAPPPSAAATCRPARRHPLAIPQEPSPSSAFSKKARRKCEGPEKARCPCEAFKIIIQK
ncbi:hypothetical protein RUM43_005739 [Polyplax serrata]|uniref:Uncharacterized protein n=1 Tax=Polyplax serrata TaxID=468196 RepID=A0AAN8P9Z4_POLSC